jgi:membrane associated rhomboid family serine protease
MAWQDRDYSREPDDGGWNPMRLGMPRITQLAMILIAVNFAVFLVQAVTAQNPAGSPLVRWGAMTLRDNLCFKQPWRLITCQYLHASVGHIFWNCLCIYFFVTPLEQLWGWRRTLAFYTVGGMASDFVYIPMSLLLQNMGYALGASGAIAACMGACAILMPQFRIVLVFFLVPIRVAVGLLVALYVLSMVGDRDYSDAAHLGGLAFGLLAPMSRPWYRRWQIKFEAWRGARQFDQEQHEQAEIDRILAKVHAQGMQSLTGGEKRTLSRASEHERQREAKRRARRDAG